MGIEDKTKHFMMHLGFQQRKDKNVMHIQTKITLSTSVQKAWEVIGLKFGHVAEWTATLESSSLEGDMGIGAVRVCKTRGIGIFPSATIKEVMTEFDPEQYRFAYKVTSGLPGMFKSAQNTFTIVPIDNKSCVVKSIAVIELTKWLRPIEWFFALLLKQDLKKVFDEMKFYIENNKVHPRKAKLLMQE